MDLGYRYDASFRDDDLPHALDGGGGRRILEIPQFPFLNDTPLYRVFRPPAEVQRVWLEELDAIYDEGLLYSLKVHPRGDTGSGRRPAGGGRRGALPGRAPTPGAWIATHADSAAWWQRRPPAASGAATAPGHVREADASFERPERRP